VVESLKKGGAAESPLIRESVEKAVALLQKSGPEFVKVSGCMSCHHQSLPQMAYSFARERGLAVDPHISQQQVKAVMAMFRPIREQLAAGKPGFPDPAVSISYALLGLAAEGYAPDETTDAMAHMVSVQQTADGSFLSLPGRPPLQTTSFASTALSLRALQRYGKDAQEQVARARRWLETAMPRTNDERTMQLLGLSWASAGVEHLRAAAQALLAEQRENGGWAQLPGIETDAYATGQALVALHTSGQVSTADPAYQRGVAFLLRTQLDDGSWLVRTRTKPFQRYKESGFPHGRHQWISAAGTSWAVMALSLTQPKTSQISQMIPADGQR
jgi:N-acyl-D-amino-acid deacylase